MPEADSQLHAVDLSSLGEEVLAFAQRTGETVEQILRERLAQLSDEDILSWGMDREQLGQHVQSYVERLQHVPEKIDSLTLLGGRNKQGEEENWQMSLLPGDKICIVGSTGSGKSRLLADIECLAQGDTPTGRRVLVNGKALSSRERAGRRRQLVAQLSQNMNFVMDLSVAQFLRLHAQSRRWELSECLLNQIIGCANELAGEKLQSDTALTQLSGGQSRALMIADTAWLSVSPIVLIDEIENAGIDRRKALDLLVGQEKIVFISTHDPLLALMCDHRIVIRNGGVHRILPTTFADQETLVMLDRLDHIWSSVRAQIRSGEEHPHFEAGEELCRDIP